MWEPSGEKRGNNSSPGADVSRVAMPPLSGTTQISPAETNAMCVAETSGYRNMRASICAAAGVHRHSAMAAEAARRQSVLIMDVGLWLEFRHECGAAHRRQRGRDFHDLPRVLRNPDRAAPWIAGRARYLDLPRGERAGGHGDLLDADHLQLPHVDLLRLQVEVAEGRLVALGERQRGDHFVRAGAVGEEHAAEIGMDGLRLVAPRH